jgi:hypothetical protein
MLSRFLDLIDNRDEKSSCFSSAVLGSGDDVLSRDNERDGLLLYRGGNEIAGLC